MTDILVVCETFKEATILHKSVASSFLPYVYGVDFIKKTILLRRDVSMKFTSEELYRRNERFGFRGTVVSSGRIWKLLDECVKEKGE